MVISSLAPLFLLWAIRGAPPIPDHYWIAICVLLAIIPNLVLFWRWRIVRRRNDHRAIVVAAARDQSEHLLVYLFIAEIEQFAAAKAQQMTLALATKVKFINFIALANFVAKHSGARLVAALNERSDLHATSGRCSSRPPKRSASNLRTREAN
jgi:hypothetical protein